MEFYFKSHINWDLLHFPPWQLGRYFCRSMEWSGSCPWALLAQTVGGIAELPALRQGLGVVFNSIAGSTLALCGTVPSPLPDSRESGGFPCFLARCWCRLWIFHRLMSLELRCAAAKIKEKSLENHGGVSEAFPSLSKHYPPFHLSNWNVSQQSLSLWTYPYKPLPLCPGMVDEVWN